MVEESRRVTAENRYWEAVRSLNAKDGDPATLPTLMELAFSKDVGSLAAKARQTLADKCSCLVLVA